MSEYRVALDVYNGPLDLLLFLIRREEVDIHDIPIALITSEYIRYIEVLREVDPEMVGDFLVLAATLMEIKSRMLLPRPPAEEEEEDVGDPRMELVRQLLEYKKFKDAARALEGAADEQSQRHARAPVLPERDPDEVELDQVEIWDLFDAFNRLLEQTGRRNAFHSVNVDDTPLALHAADIIDALNGCGGTMKFEELFGGRGRAEMIGLFLALLELIRRWRIRASQEKASSPILVHLLDDTPLGEEIDAETPNVFYHTEDEEVADDSGDQSRDREGAEIDQYRDREEAANPTESSTGALDQEMESDQYRDPGESETDQYRDREGAVNPTESSTGAADQELDGFTHQDRIDHDIHTRRIDDVITDRAGPVAPSDDQPIRHGIRSAGESDRSDHTNETMREDAETEHETH